MRSRFTGLWTHRDFLKLWGGQSVALVGSEIRWMALSLVAILVLDATPSQIGMLTAIGGIAPMLAGIFMGAWVDRRRKRPVMIVTDWCRVALLVTVPVAAWLDVLRIEHVYVVSVGLGMISLLFEIAYRSYLPTLVERDQLVEGNSKLEMSASGAEILGPAIGGPIVQLFTAPAAVLTAAGTFVVSAVSLSLIRKEEESPDRTEQTSLLREAADGVKVVAVNPILRSLAGGIGVLELFEGVLAALFLLYITRELEVNPALIGMIMAIGGVGFVFGALVTERITGRIGLGPAIVGGVAVSVTGTLVLPLTGGPLAAIVALLILSQLLFGFGFTVFNIGQVSLRQSVTPPELQGRMNATMEVLHMGGHLGALAGGFLGEAIGLREMLFVAVAGEAIAVVWLLLSPVMKIRQPPEPMA